MYCEWVIGFRIRWISVGNFKRQFRFFLLPDVEKSSHWSQLMFLRISNSILRIGNDIDPCPIFTKVKASQSIQKSCFRPCFLSVFTKRFFSFMFHSAPRFGQTHFQNGWKKNIDGPFMQVKSEVNEGKKTLNWKKDREKDREIERERESERDNK